jgi:diadenosine tetraphosphate (Ap4A) HIT family hydrolase
MFELHPRLFSDTFEICELSHSKLLLMNDARFVWCIIVPRITGAVEWHDLDETTANGVFAENMAVSRALKTLEGIDKINIGAIGNVVSQLHIHVIGRKINDVVWPAPVWGNGIAEPYNDAGAKNIIEKIKTALENTL